MTINNKLILRSQLDKSVNIITESDIGYFEARYVRRTDRTFIVYLSSQSGCDQGCRFCHLTRTGQTKFINGTHNELVDQAKQVYEVYDNDIPAEIVHYNFMSRGEPLNNPHLNKEVLETLGEMALSRNLSPLFKISTIMPKSYDGDLVKRFSPITPDIYYSLYTMNPETRKKWLPKAKDPNEALDILKDYQKRTGKIIRLHWANIQGVNDSKHELDKIIEAVNDRQLMVMFNFVKYNAFSDSFSAEVEQMELEDNLQYLLDNIPGAQGQIVSRVGFDVHASCGTFYS